MGCIGCKFGRMGLVGDLAALVLMPLAVVSQVRADTPSFRADPGTPVLGAAGPADDLPSVQGIHVEERAAYLEDLRRVALEADAYFGGAPCPAVTVEQVGLRMFVFTSAPNVVGWEVRLRVTGCGRTTTQNVIFGRWGGARPWDHHIQVPGESLADVLEQSWTLQNVGSVVQAGLGAPCTTLTLGDVYIGARRGHVRFLQPGEGDPGQGITVSLTPELSAIRDELDLEHAWMEVWPIRACGHDRMLGIVFIERRDVRRFYPMFLPIWPTTEVHGPNARPAPDPDGSGASAPPPTAARRGANAS
jgi:hypothetical protein